MSADSRLLVLVASAKPILAAGAIALLESEPGEFEARVLTDEAEEPDVTAVVTFDVLGTWRPTGRMVAR